MRRPPRFLRGCGIGCRKTAKYLLNGALFASFVFLGGVLYAEWRGLPIRLPEPALRYIVELASPEDVSISWDRVAPDALSTFHFHGLEVRHIPTDSLVLRARSLRARFNWVALATGFGSPVEFIEAGGAQLHIPSMWSISGVPESVLEDFACAIHFRYNGIEIRDLRARFGTARLRLHGRLAPSGTTAAVGEPRITRDTLRNLSQEVSRWQRATMRWQPSWIDAEVQPVDGGRHRVQLSAVAESLVRTELGELEALRIAGYLDLAPGYLPRGEVTATAESLMASNAFAEGLQARLRLPEPGSPPRLDWHSRHLSYDRFEVADFGGSVEAMPDRRFRVSNGRAWFAGAQIEFLGFLDPDDASQSSAQIVVRADPAGALAAIFPGFDPFPVSAHPRSRIQADVSWESDWLQPVARLTGDFKDFSVAGESYHHAYVDGSATPTAVHLGPIEVFDAGGQQAQGEFAIDFGATSFRISATGSHFPRRLDAYLRGNWWKGLRERIAAGASPFEADVDVLANWSDFNETRSVVWVSGQDFTYRDYPVESAEAFVRRGPEGVDLRTLRATTFDGGTLNGTLGWRFGGEAGSNRTLLIDLQSSVPIPAVAAAFEQPWIGEQFDSLRGPDLRIEGWHTSWGNGDTSVSLALDIEAQNVAYKGTPAESLRLFAQVENEAIQFDIKELAVFDGTITGTAGFADRHSKESPVHLDLRGQRLAYARVTEALRKHGWIGAADDVPASSAADRGLVRFAVAGTGALSDLTGFAGRGFLELKNTDLGTVRLVGNLSRVLEQVGLPLTSFSLNALTSSFTVERGLIRVPDLTIQGPTLRIQAEGEVSFPGQRIALDVRVFPLSSEANPLLAAFGFVFRPLTYAMELELSGTIEDPAWRFKHNPLNIFRSSHPALKGLSADTGTPTTTPRDSDRSEPRPDSGSLRRN